MADIFRSVLLLNNPDVLEHLIGSVRVVSVTFLRFLLPAPSNCRTYRVTPLSCVTPLLL
jgi:hypothetical protein